jgi:hypothetical protein
MAKSARSNYTPLIICRLPPELIAAPCETKKGPNAYVIEPGATLIPKFQALLIANKQLDKAVEAAIESDPQRRAFLGQPVPRASPQN